MARKFDIDPAHTSIARTIRRSVPNSRTARLFPRLRRAGMVLIGGMMMTGTAWAGDSLQAKCPGHYYDKQIVSAINFITNYNGVGPAMNVEVGSNWYSLYLNGNNSQAGGANGFYQAVLDARRLGSQVNICVSMGELSGLELVFPAN